VWYLITVVLKQTWFNVISYPLRYKYVKQTTTKSVANARTQDCSFLLDSWRLQSRVRLLGGRRSGGAVTWSHVIHDLHHPKPPYSTGSDLVTATRGQTVSRGSHSHQRRPWNPHDAHCWASDMDMDMYMEDSSRRRLQSPWHRLRTLTQRQLDPYLSGECSHDLYYVIKVTFVLFRPCSFTSDCTQNHSS
jgi:hypothetical protein